MTVYKSITAVHEAIWVPFIKYNSDDNNKSFSFVLLTAHELF